MVPRQFNRLQLAAGLPVGVNGNTSDSHGYVCNNSGSQQSCSWHTQQGMAWLLQKARRSVCVRVAITLNLVHQCSKANTTARQTGALKLKAPLLKVLTQVSNIVQ